MFVNVWKLDREREHKTSEACHAQPNITAQALNDDAGKRKLRFRFRPRGIPTLRSIPKADRVVGYGEGMAKGGSPEVDSTLLKPHDESVGMKTTRHACN